MSYRSAGTNFYTFNYKCKFMVFCVKEKIIFQVHKINYK